MVRSSAGPRREHGGFSLIELLVVIAVLATLSGLLMVGVDALRRSGRRTRTVSTMNAVRLALGTSSAQRGGQIDAAEHPLAGSLEPRARFVRHGGGPALSTIGEALVVESLAIVHVSARPRVLLPDDRYVGYAVKGDLPFLFGVARDRIGILGPAIGPDPSPTKDPAKMPGLTGFRRLPSKHDATGKVLPADGFDSDGNGVLDGEPYTDAGSPGYPDVRFLTTSTATDWEGDSRRLIDHALGSGTAAEVLQSKGLITTTVPADGDPAADNRVVVLKGSVRPTWAPGHVQVAGTWKRYRLRGTAIVDGWGNEILFTTGSAGGVRLVSAGPDGVIRWHPGADGVYQTDPDAEAPAGDDRDGSRDNITATTGD